MSVCVYDSVCVGACVCVCVYVRLLHHFIFHRHILYLLLIRLHVQMTERLRLNVPDLMTMMTPIPPKETQTHQLLSGTYQIADLKKQEAEMR